MIDLRPELEPLPLKLRGLPVDDRGYPVPFFVAWVEGKPDFRVMDPKKWQRAVRDKLCWVCGQPLGRYMVFVVGGMCGINRTSSEPPCHMECAQWSARNCPFLSRPHMHRREGGLPESHVEPAGFMLSRNPGVTLLWVTTSYTIFKADAGGPGYLISFGDPTQVQWIASGRPATREEVEASIEGGLPALEAMCQQDKDPAEARRALQRYHERLIQLYPAA